MKSFLKDKKAIALFLSLTFIMTWFLDFSIILGYDLIPLANSSMFCPGIAALIVKLLYYRDEKVLGLGRCSAKSLMFSLLFPLFYLGVSYAIFLLIYRDYNSGYLFTDDLYYSLTLIPAYVITAAGEEIGWRGFLFPKLNGFMGFKKAALISGLIWSLWHYPMIIYFHSEIPPLWYQLIFFTVEITLIGIILAYLRLKTGSILPAVIVHASHNYFDQIVFGPMTNSYFASYFAGETGFITLLLVIAAVLYLYRKNKNEIRKF